MPTSSERLEARANAYMEAVATLRQYARDMDDALECEEYDRLADKLDVEYHRLQELAEKRKEKEKHLEHRRSK